MAWALHGLATTSEVGIEPCGAVRPTARPRTGHARALAEGANPSVNAVDDGVVHSTWRRDPGFVAAANAGGIRGSCPTVAVEDMRAS